MENRKQAIENIKNVIMVVLFISAILLLTFFWKDFSINDLNNLHFGINTVEEDTFQPEIQELLVPAQIETGFGNGMNTVVSYDHELAPELVISMPENDTQKENTAVTENDQDQTLSSKNTIYNTILAAVEHYLTGTDLIVEKIEKTQYDEVMSYRSLTAVFDYDIPFREYLLINDLTVAGGIDQIKNITKIGFSSASSENMFIYDDSVDAYYRIVNNDKAVSEYMSAAIIDISESIEQEGNATYYSIQSLAGTQNNNLMPLYLDSSLGEVAIREAFNISRASSVSRMEQLFFPNGLDFVRKITENKGSLLYMYGYSEKVLMLDENGSISYKEELETKAYSEVSFTAALETAIEYITSHGGWRTLYSDSMRPYIADCKVKTDPSQGYRSYDFTVGMMFEGTPVNYASGDMIRVCVYGDQITSYYRDIIIPEHSESIEVWTAKDAINIVTDEHVAICEILEEHSKAQGDAEQAQKYAGENKFEEMMQNTDSIRLNYLRDSSGHPSSLIPVWALEIDGCSFWCDPVEGDLLMYKTGEVS